MGWLRTVSGIFFALCLTLALPACETDGAAEEAGENVDEAVEETGEALEDVGEDAQR